MPPAFVPFRFPGQQHRIAHCQIALIEQLPGTFCDHLCHRSHFGSRYSWGRCDFQGFEQGLNKVSSFQAVPTQDSPPHAYLCHFQSAFCLTLPTPPMPDASKWGQILFSSAPSRIAARHKRPPGVKPGHKHGRLVCCRYTTGAMTLRAEPNGFLVHFCLSAPQSAVHTKQSADSAVA